ncbi:MAG: MBL fold metallo-hydrolase [Pseudomonadota bacterium]
MARSLTKTFLSLTALSLASLASPIAKHAMAQEAELPPSQCMAIAQNIGDDFPVMFASMSANPLDTISENDTVGFKFEGHSTWRITTPEGVTIATDFSGSYGANPAPRVITMNRAHSTHYTLNPDPAIEVVLPGWDNVDPRGIDHDVVVDDVYIRNVATDIRSWGGDMMVNANSIFIFETAGLCIGHMGHLHHPLTEDHFAEIGRLDVVMVPVDGGLTLSHAAMADLTNRLRSSVVLPMHLRGRSISSFTSMMGSNWAVDFLEGDTLELSIRTLPRQPTIMVPISLSVRG